MTPAAAAALAASVGTRLAAPMMGLAGLSGPNAPDPIALALSGPDFYTDVYDGGGGNDAAMVDDYEARLFESYQYRYAMIRLVEALMTQITGAPQSIDESKSFPRGANYGSYYGGMIVFTSGVATPGPT